MVNPARPPWAGRVEVVQEPGFEPGTRTFSGSRSTGLSYSYGRRTGYPLVSNPIIGGPLSPWATGTSDRVLREVETVSGIEPEFGGVAIRPVAVTITVARDAALPSTTPWPTRGNWTGTRPDRRSVERRVEVVGNLGFEPRISCSQSRRPGQAGLIPVEVVTPPGFEPGSLGLRGRPSPSKFRSFEVA